MKRNALPIPGQPARLDEPLAAPAVLHAQSHMDREWQIRRLFAGLATPTLQIATVDCPTLMASENVYQRFLTRPVSLYIAPNCGIETWIRRRRPGVFRQIVVKRGWRFPRRPARQIANNSHAVAVAQFLDHLQIKFVLCSSRCASTSRLFPATVKVAP